MAMATGQRGVRVKIDREIRAAIAGQTAVASPSLGLLASPARVQILKSRHGDLPPGRIAYAIARDACGGVEMDGRRSEIGELAYLVSPGHPRSMRSIGGARWLQAQALRFLP